MTFEQWKAGQIELYRRADRHRAMVTERIRRLARDAGLDPSIPTLHAHNAIASYQRGRPWRGVDYSKARRILWLERTRLFAASRIADSVGRKRWERIAR